ncbi:MULTISPECIES: hypothetical protein [Rhodococcus]|uniref:hypothetical protein n=1 Tax=Rhodococcus TaxID=1827 RepID=UPI000A50B417|nr:MULTISPECIES: hypothetical protein [Rhodococcus]WAL49564.1 hypothetical protein OQN32_27565 [Rhodococcus pyridinivorans]
MTTPAFARAGANRFGRPRGPVPVATAQSPHAAEPAPTADLDHATTTSASDAAQTADQGAPEALRPEQTATKQAPNEPTTDDTHVEHSAPEQHSPRPTPNDPPSDSDASDPEPEPDVAPEPEAQSDQRKPSTKRTSKSTRRPKKDTDSDVMPLVVIQNGKIIADGPVHVLDLDNITDLDDVDLLELVRGLRVVGDSDLKASSVKTLMNLIETKALTG